MHFDTLTIIGVGLIGGSIGLATRRRNLVRQVCGVGRSQAAIETALSIGAIDSGLLSPVNAVEDADLVVVCTPVDQIASEILRIAPSCRPGTIITDTGSTKAMIVESIVNKMPRGVHFIGGHPLAGSEKSGVEYADSDLFRERVCVLTPTESTHADALQKLSEFWQALGSRVRLMSPEEHDQAVAMTSHLPHVIASALAGVLPDDLRELTASGFRDTTRIAAGDPALWQAILSQNRSALLKALDILRGRLELFNVALENDHSSQLTDLLGDGKRRRDALGN